MEIERSLPDSSIPWKLWIYTNYDCNLRCSYCCSRSSPTTASNRLTSSTFYQLVDEAVLNKFECIFLTGGEPFLHPEIYNFLEYASKKIQTVILTNSMLITEKDLDRLQKIHCENLIIQISVDGAQADQHDPYRGEGTWKKTVSSIHRLLERKMNLRISTTETPINSNHLKDLCELHTSLGIPEKDHVIRPLARRGFSEDGISAGKDCLFPEITVNCEGAYWHPLSTDEDMLITRQVFPLLNVKDAVQKLFDERADQKAEPLKKMH